MDQIEYAARRLASGLGATLHIQDQEVWLVPSALVRLTGQMELMVACKGRVPFYLDQFRKISAARLLARLYRPTIAYELAENLNLLQAILIDYSTPDHHDGGHTAMERREPRAIALYEGQ